ncbi:hypothetical protein TIFTF001_056220 [Ficus carica]|uniref:Uncharacterized protein n=1 Tax=Ficus carica TaxID=3494 RepID=A0AA88JHW3_FICCA|nr:hypothetical protein TIFTF001_056220 [Ficus carica]
MEKKEGVSSAVTGANPDWNSGGSQPISELQRGWTTQIGTLKEKNTSAVELPPTLASPISPPMSKDDPMNENHESLSQPKKGKLGLRRGPRRNGTEDQEGEDGGAPERGRDAENEGGRARDPRERAGKAPG